MVKVIQAINCKILLERLGYRSHNSSAPWGFVSFETEGYLFICMGFFHFFFQCCYKRVYLELIWCKICLKFWPVKSLFHRPGFSRIIRIFFVSLLKCLRTDIYKKIFIFHRWKGIQWLQPKNSKIFIKRVEKVHVNSYSLFNNISRILNEE